MKTTTHILLTAALAGGAMFAPSAAFARGEESWSAAQRQARDFCLEKFGLSPDTHDMFEGVDWSKQKATERKVRKCTKKKREAIKRKNPELAKQIENGMEMAKTLAKKRKAQQNSVGGCRKRAQENGMNPRDPRVIKTCKKDIHFPWHDRNNIFNDNRDGTFTTAEKIGKPRIE